MYFFPSSKFFLIDIERQGFLWVSSNQVLMKAYSLKCDRGEMS